MNVFLIAFGLHNPFAGPRLQEHSLMPIAIDVPGGFDLDYSALLIAESFVCDTTAFEFIRDRRDRYLAPMWKSLDRLKSEGLLEVVDYGERCRPFHGQLEKKATALLDDVRPWLSIAREQWARVRPEFEEFARSYSDPAQVDFDAAHFGIISYLERRDGRIDERESRRLHDLLVRRRRVSTAEEVDVREMLKPLVAQVLMNDLLRHQLKAPFIDWDDAEKFYERLHLSQWDGLDPSVFPGAEVANQARRLFRVVVPELLPGRIDDVVSFLRDQKAVVSLRNEMRDLMHKGESPSKEWMQTLHNEAARAQLRTQDRGRVIKWAGRIVDLVLPGIGLAGEILVDSAEEAVEEGVTGRTQRRFEWYYALQRIQMKRE